MQFAIDSGVAICLNVSSVPVICSNVYPEYIHIVFSGKRSLIVLHKSKIIGWFSGSSGSPPNMWHIDGFDDMFFCVFGIWVSVIKVPCYLIKAVFTVMSAA